MLLPSVEYKPYIHSSENCNCYLQKSFSKFWSLSLTKTQAKKVVDIFWPSESHSIFLSTLGKELRSMHLLGLFCLENCFLGGGISDNIKFSFWSADVDWSNLDFLDSWVDDYPYLFPPPQINCWENFLIYNSSFWLHPFSTFSVFLDPLKFFGLMKDKFLLWFLFVKSYLVTIFDWNDMNEI